MTGMTGDRGAIGDTGPMVSCEILTVRQVLLGHFLCE